MKKKWIVMLLALVLCLSACGQADSGADTAPADTAQTESAETGEKETADTPAEEPAQEEVQEPETAPATELYNADGIQVTFGGEASEVSGLFRTYSMMFTWTQDSHYAIAPDAGFTVTNNRENGEDYLTVYILEYLRSEESFVSVVNYDGEFKELDMLGEYWGTDECLMLSEQPATEVPAGETLYWADELVYGEQIREVRVCPGESVAFYLPEREADSIYNLFVSCNNDTAEGDLPMCKFVVSADDVSAPSTAVAP